MGLPGPEPSRGHGTAIASGSGPRAGTYLPPPPGSAAGQRSPASSNGPNGRAEPLAEKRGAKPGTGAHLRSRPPSRPPPAPTPSLPAPRPAGAVAPPQAAASQSPPHGQVLTMTVPGSGELTPPGVSVRLAQPRGPAQARRGGSKRPGPAAPPPPPAPAFPVPGRAPLRPWLPPPGSRRSAGSHPAPAPLAPQARPPPIGSASC